MMPILQVYVTDDTLGRLKRIAKFREREVEELAESAVEDAAIHDRDGDPVSPKDNLTEQGEKS